jgi:hypothetical protein
LNKQKQNRPAAAKSTVIAPLDDVINRYFWLVIPVFTFIYFILSKYSIGFYQDDEIGQYLNMIDFWSDPLKILGNNPKPGYKIFLVLPSLLGYNAVLIVNSLIASLTVFFIYKLLKVYKINYAYLGAFLLAFQPLYFDLSFRSYSEIFTALCIVVFLILFQKEKYSWSALLAGYLFTIRQEMALFLIALSIIFLFRKKYLCAVAVFVFPVVYNLLGYFKTGDILFVLTEMKSVASLSYTSQGPLHYLKFYIFIVGPVCLSFFLTGFFGFLYDFNEFKKHFQKYLLPYILFILVFGVLMLTMVNDGSNPGNWRYLLHISPVCALFATIGFNTFSDKKHSAVNYIILGLAFIITFLFFSKVSDGFKFKEPAVQDFTKVIFILILSALTFIIPKKNPTDYLNKLSVLILALSVIYVVVDFKPKVLSAENLTMKNTAEYLNSGFSQSPEFYCNHPFVKFYSNFYKNDPLKFKNISRKKLETAKTGAIIIWDRHYGYRPDFKDLVNNDSNDVTIEILKADSLNYKVLNQFVSGDRSFYTTIFEKIK